MTPKNFPKQSRPEARPTVVKGNGNQGESKPHVMYEATYYEGQLPPPNMIQAYNEIMPDFGERMLSMVERREAFNIKKENKIINGTTWLSSLGLALAFLFSLSVFVLCYLGFKMGYPTQSATITTTVIGVAGIFIWRQKGRTNTKK
jgi:uncharacterized membrane protein